MVQEKSSAMSSQKREAAATREPRSIGGGEPVPDLTDFMNDWFFGSADVNKRAYNLSGGSTKEGEKYDDEEEEGSGAKNQTSRLTLEWLEEAKKIVAGSPSSPGSPASLFGSPKFGADVEAKEPSMLIDRRDPLSRSARRHKSLEGISDEILRRSSARHSRNPSSDSFLPPGDTRLSVAFSGDPQHPTSDEDEGSRPPPPLPPKLPFRRTSRFRQETPSAPHFPAASATTAAPTSRRTFRGRSPAPPPEEDAAPRQRLLSPPRNLVESAHRMSVSSTTCSMETLSRSEKEKASIHRRALSSSFETSDSTAEAPSPGDVRQINAFLKRQRKMIGWISSDEVSAKAKIILSGSSNNLSTTSSMIAAICYAWLLGNREVEEVVVPVLNIERGRMNKHKQAAWLFNYVGVDASALLFADEVDLENLLMARQLSILVIGQDVLKTNNEVGSLCTVLTDNYCEEAYDLLKNPNLKKLLLAGILLDTRNLNDTVQPVTMKDADAVRLLLVGSFPNYRHEFFEQLMQDHKDSSFLEALKNNYGNPTNETKEKPRPVPSPTPAPLPVKAPQINSRGKNKFFLAKWFGFGSK
ncbi:hypothetical protein Cni_G27537 [Canna indica]|uniref:Uncharacterized protein n=1 Tax=Canna indica TaxID=4628 RepID=A0AAQ3L1X1_9LILI|nr:hypothetical protein Cni_G27537 [Canna indica]